MCGDDAVHHDILRHLVGLGLNHDDFIARTGDCAVHLALGALGGGRVNQIFAVNIAERDGCDRTVKRHVGDADGDGGADRASNLGLTVVVDRHDCTRYNNVVSEVCGEKRAHGAVDCAAGKHSLLGRAGLSAEKASRDLSHGVELFLKIDREREIVDPVPRTGGSRNGHENACLAVFYHYSGVCKLGELARLERKRAPGELHRV